MNPYQIRLAKREDTRAILNIYAPFILNTTSSFETEVPTEAAFYQRIQNILSESPFLVCTYQEKVVGYAYASSHRARAAYGWSREVSVYIAPDFHGKKIGTALYTSLIELLKLQGYTNILAGITLPNPVSIAFHKSIGFQPIGIYEKVGFKFGNYVDTQWWSLFVGEEPPKVIKSLEEILETAEWELVIEKGLMLIRA
ncbi:MAG: N-acetyltransferase family protein [Bacteroidota bacterium]